MTPAFCTGGRDAVVKHLGATDMAFLLGRFCSSPGSEGVWHDNHQVFGCWRAGAGRAEEPAAGGHHERGGGSAGIGLETARLARAKGADVILAARDPDCLHRVGLELRASIAAFDATDFGRLGRFFDALSAPIDHLLVTGPSPHDMALKGFDPDGARRHLHPQLPPPWRSPARAPTICHGKGSTSMVPAATSTPISCCRCRSPGTVPAGSA